jgi:hypothetical protein
MSEQNKRHSFLTIWLCLIVILNLLGGIYYLLNTDKIHELVPTTPLWVIKIQADLAIFNVVCAVALFNWKRWGFWGYCATGVISCFLNIFFSSISIPKAIIISSFSVLMLFWALNVGKEQKA